MAEDHGKDPLRGFLEGIEPNQKVSHNFLTRLKFFERITLVLSAGAIIYGVIYGVLYWQTASWQFLIPIVGILVALVLAVITTRLARRGYLDMGGYLLVFALALAYGSAELAFSHATIYIALGGLMLIVLSGNIFLPQKRTAWLVVAVLFGLFIGLVNTFEPIARYDVRQSTLLNLLLPGLTALLGLLIMWQILRVFAAGDIRTRLIISFLVLVVAPLLISGGISTWNYQRSAIIETYNRLSAIAELKENSIDLWLTNVQAMLRLTLREREATLAEYLRRRGSGAETGTEELAFIQNVAQGLNNTLARTTLFEELFVLDLNGQVVISTDTAQVDKIFGNQVFFQEGLKGDYVQPPQYSPSLGVISIVLARPLMTSDGNVGGVLAGRVALSTLNEVMLAEIGGGETGETYLVRANNSLLTPVRAEGYPVGDTYIRSEGVNRAVKEQQNGSGSYLDYRGSEVFGAYRWLPDLQLGLIAEVNTDEALHASESTTYINLFVLIGSALVAVFLSLYITGTIANPISELAAAANQISAGNLDVKINTQQRSDEIGTLATTFDEMAHELRQTLDTLEQRIADRTRALETSTEVSRRISTILDQRQLVQEVVQQVRNAFDYYHVHIYLFDEKKENLLMVGGTGEAGRELLHREHKIAIGHGLVGRAAATNLPILVPDVSQAEGWLPNPLLPETKSEVAVPIAIGENVFGVLDVQDDETGGLAETDVNLLTSIANQVAIAIQNARAYQQAQRQADREALIGNINQQIQNTTTIDDALKVAARELGRALGTETSVKLTQASSGNGTKTHGIEN